MNSPDWADKLPVPYAALLSLGLSPEEIQDAWDRRPEIVANQAAEHPGAYYSIPHADRAIKAIQSFKHTRGRWGASPLILAPWQLVWCIAPVFGWLYYDEESERDVRVIRHAYFEVPRKNGKSTLSSGIGLTLLLADREPGAEVYAAAGSKEQAMRVMEDAKRMAATSDAVRGRSQIQRNLIKVPHTGGVFRALSKVAEAAHGLNVSGAVIDELHVHQNRDLYDAIVTGTGARDQPLVVVITTADEGTEGTIYDEVRTFTERCAEGTAHDPQSYGIVWCAPEGADPFDPETWARANPGLGVSPSLSYIKREAEKAKSTPSYMSTFMRLSLNVRMRSTTRWIDLPLWDKGDRPVSTRATRIRRAWGGVDLSAVSDLSAWVLVVESKQPGVELEIVPRFWIPEERVDELSHQLHVPLRQWAKDGLLTLTEGDAVDYDAIERQIVADCKKYNVQRISYDRMFAGQLVQRVQSKTKGVQLAPVAQTYLGMGPGAKELERLLRESLVVHGGDPVMRWNASVVEIIADQNDNFRPVKPDRHKSAARIDGIAALVMALDGYIRRPLRRARAIGA